MGIACNQLRHGKCCFRPLNSPFREEAALPSEGTVTGFSEWKEGSPVGEGDLVHSLSLGQWARGECDCGEKKTVRDLVRGWSGDGRR